jgi:hypothetical protein
MAVSRAQPGESDVTDDVKDAVFVSIFFSP